MSLGNIPVTGMKAPIILIVPLSQVFCADKIICTIGIFSSFKEQPVETLTFWDIQIPSSSITRVGESTWYLSISKLLNSVLSQLLQEYSGDVSRFEGLFKCFQNAKRNHVATLRVPDFSRNVNLEILGYRTFPGTLEDSFAEMSQPSYTTSVFSSDEENPFTQAFLANSPEVLLGVVNKNRHAHFVVLIEDYGTLSSPPTASPPIELPTEPFPELYFVPEILSESTSSFSLQPPPSPSPSPSPFQALETYEDYIYSTFQRSLEPGVCSHTGRTKRRLWLGIRNHRNACELLTLGGFTNLSDDEEYLEFPSGKRLSLFFILTSEFGWVVSTFKKKLAYYNSCTQYTASHRWNLLLFPPMGKLYSFLFFFSNA